MAKLKDVLAFLRERGWSEYRHKGGSHRVWGHPDGRQITIAIHSGKVTTQVFRLKAEGYKLSRKTRTCLPCRPAGDRQVKAIQNLQSNSLQSSA